MKKGIFIFICIFLISMVACSKNKEEENDIVAKFENSIFIGDSITNGFDFYEILPSKCVLAGAGTTAGFIYKDIDSIFEYKPDNIFIMLGSIDILMPVENPKELFRNDLTKLINKIKDELPNSTIYLQSITPVEESAIERQDLYLEIDDYNEIIIEVANNVSVSYIDIQPLVEENPNLYAEDGVHFKKNFYYLWLEKLYELIQ